MAGRFSARVLVSAALVVVMFPPCSAAPADEFLKYLSSSFTTGEPSSTDQQWEDGQPSVTLSLCLSASIAAVAASARRR